jgi:predicted nucleic acid-binding Zn finger protein
MDNKKQLCYHIVAQQIAEALGQFEVSDMPDTRYDEVAAKWAAQTNPRRS